MQVVCDGVTAVTTHVYVQMEKQASTDVLLSKSLCLVIRHWHCEAVWELHALYHIAYSYFT